MIKYKADPYCIIMITIGIYHYTSPMHF